MKMLSTLALAASALMVATAASAQVKQLPADPLPRPVAVRKPNGYGSTHPNQSRR